VDSQDFLKALAEVRLKTGWQTHAYCLMRNHFHLVIETPNANLVEGMLSRLENAACRRSCTGRLP
jgi:putative transposase